MLGLFRFQFLYAPRTWPANLKPVRAASIKRISIMKRIVWVGASLATTLFLAGCSGEPSTADIKQAMSANSTEQTSFAMLKGLNPALPNTFEEFVDSLSIEKGECKQVGDAPGYVCDFRAGMNINGAPQFGPWTRARFFKVNGQWNEEVMR